MLARDGRERASNTRYTGRIHGCPRASWVTPGGYCRSSKHNIGHSRDLSRTDRHVQARVQEVLDVWGFDYCVSSHLGASKHDVGGKRETRGLAVLPNTYELHAA